MIVPAARLPGGLHPAEHKDESTQRPIQTVPLPERLYLPLQQYSGSPAQAMVKPGQRVLKNKRLSDASSGLSAPLHAPTSGTVIAIEDRPFPHPSGLSAPCIVLEPDGRDEIRVAPHCPDPMTRDPDGVADCVRRAGIVGLGGAVFPTHAKIHGHRGYDHIHTLIINGAECEPYITCDDMLMRERPDQVLDGIRIIRHAVLAKRCVIGIEENKPEALEALRNALERLDMDRDIEICVVPTVYPSGGERQLIQLLTGKEVPSGGLPLDIGVVCVNVGTAAAVSGALRGFQPLTRRIVTVTGSGVRNPGNYDVAIGTPVSELIAAAGGYTDTVKHLVMGGPMMGIALADDSMPVVKATNCIIAAAEGEFREPEPAMPCIRCGYCAEHCPVNLLPQQLYWYSKAKDFEKVEEYRVFDCIECGVCSYVCPSHIPLVDYFRYGKSELRNQAQGRELAERARLRVEARTLRQEREKAERAARAAARKNAAPKKKAPAKAASPAQPTAKASSADKTD
ncbi:MAG: electron transport complex subunit RsxC [Gammaproteobacteria bacterium]